MTVNFLTRVSQRWYVIHLIISCKHLVFVFRVILGIPQATHPRRYVYVSL